MLFVHDSSQSVRSSKGPKVNSLPKCASERWEPVAISVSIAGLVVIEVQCDITWWPRDYAISVRLCTRDIFKPRRMRNIHRTWGILFCPSKKNTRICKARVNDGHIPKKQAQNRLEIRA